MLLSLSTVGASPAPSQVLIDKSSLILDLRLCFDFDEWVAIEWCTTYNRNIYRMICFGYACIVLANSVIVTIDLGGGGGPRALDNCFWAAFNWVQSPFYIFKANECMLWAA